MKKNYFKKSLSLIMTVLMIMSCWVFIAPTEAGAISYEALEKANQDAIASLSGTTDITANVIGSFPHDSSGYDKSVAFKNVLYSPAYTNTDRFTGVANISVEYNQNMWGNGSSAAIHYHYSTAVLMYDGITTPSIGVLMTHDGNKTGGTSTFKSTTNGSWLENTDGLVINEFWRGQCGGNLDFSWAIHQGNAADYRPGKYEYYFTTDSKSSSEPSTANIIKYTGKLADDKYTSGALFPNFHYYGSGSSGGERNATNQGGSAIYVINVVPLKKAYEEALSVYNLITADYTKYTKESVAEYISLAQALLNANPNKYTWSSNTSETVNTYAKDAKAAVDAWNKWYKKTTDGTGGLVECKYTITWVVDGEQTEETSRVTKEGVLPVYPGGQPTKEHEKEGWYWVFTGWNPEVVPVSGDAAYVAQFEEKINTYTVRFFEADGTLINKTVYNHGDIVNVPAAAEIPGKTFIGWDTPVETVVKKDVDYIAQYRETYSVIFKNGDTVLEVHNDVPAGSNITYGGATPTKASDAVNRYDFDGWDVSTSNIQSSVVATAKFKEIPHENFEYLEDVGYIPATCTTPATLLKRCADCHYTFGYEVYSGTVKKYKVQGHNYDGQPAVAGTDDGNGNHIVRCKFYITRDCKGIKSETHTFKDTGVISATCSSVSVTNQKCACGATTKVYGTEFNPDVHLNTTRKGYVSATCTTPGYEGDIYCNDCKTTIEKGKEIPFAGHNFDAEIESDEYNREDKSCTVALTYWYACSNCAISAESVKDDPEYADVTLYWVKEEATGHDFTAETVHEDYLKAGATCTTKTTYYKSCAVCGLTSEGTDEEATFEVGDVLGHDYTGAIKEKGDGTHYYLCKNDCGTYGFKGIKNASTACKYGEWDTTGADNHVKTCTECSYKFEEEHDWSDWTSTDMSKTEAGQHSKTCSVCNKVVAEDCTYTEKSTAETCTSAGYTTHTCNVCKHQYETSGNSKTGHDFEDPECKIKNNGDGTHSFYCVRECGAYGYGEVEGAYIECALEYTNAGTGKHEAICKECGYTKTENCSGGEATCSTPATCEKCSEPYGTTSAHVFEGAVVVFEGGKHAYRCKYCVDNTSIYGVGSKEGATEDCKFNGEVVALGGEHAYKCSICKDADYGNEEACSGGTATCKDLAVCVICQETYGELNADAHVWGKWTSDGKGNHTRTCTLGCTLENRTETVACTTENATAVKTPAACNKNSYTTYTCNDCGYEWKVEDKNTALGHEWSAWTKNGDGTHTRTCLRECGEADATQTLNCADNAVAKVTAPTCLEGGYTTYTCKDCGHTWEDEAARTPAKGHTFETKRVTDELIKTRKDCTTPLTYWYICNDCELSAKEVENNEAYAGKTLFWQSEAAAGHNFTAEIADEKYLVAGSSATCTTKVKYYKSCKACGVSSKDTDDEATFESGKILGHNWVKPADDKLATYLATPADCITDATYYYVCSRCGISSNGVISATWAKAGTKTGHDFDHNGNGDIKDEGDTGYTAYVAPTCDKKGIKEHYTCEVCKKNFADAEGKTVITETSIKASGHAWLSVGYKAATCEEDGYARHQKCTVCGAESDHDKYPMLGHTYGAEYGYYCDEDNYYHAYGCKNGCGTYGVGAEKYTVILDDAGKVAEIKGGEACDFDGEYVKVENEGAHSHKKVCECGNEKSEACSDAKPETIAPSCAAEGYDLYICDTCSQEWKTNYTNKTEHDYSKATWVAAAGDVHIKKCSNYDKCKSYIEEACYSDDTSTGTGCDNQKTCKVCYDTFGASVQHDWVEKVDEKYLKSAANCDSPAVYYVSCSQCGKAHETVTFTYGEKRAHEMSDYVFTIEGWAFAPADFDVSQLKMPNCGSEGKSISYCANCDYYKLKIEISSSTSHTWKYDIDNVDKWEVVGGNCGTGVTKKNYCTVCGETTTKTVADPHTWSAVVIENATCTDNGFIELTCTTCFADKLLSGAKKADFVFDGVDYADKYPAVIAKGHHEWVDTAAEGEATMEVDGKLVFVEKYPAYNADGRGYSKCKVCAVKEPVKIPAYGNDPANHKHPELGEAGKNTLKTVAKVEPTCIVGGHLEYKECTRCSYSQYMIDHDAFYLAPLGHSDSDNNGECDVCEKNLNGDKTDNCSCMCHKDSGFMKFIYKILRFFWKLFGSNKACDCGKVHY